MANYEQMTDEQLIEKLRKGDRDIMDYIMEKYKNLVRKEANAMYLLGGESVPQRLSAARLYVAEALAEEAVTVEDVSLAPAGDGRSLVAVRLRYHGEELSVTLTV